MLSRKKRTTGGGKGAITERPKDGKLVWRGCVNSELILFVRNGGAELNYFFSSPQP
jgi:hypothetical protein